VERPASFADLEAWSVYGDWLEQQGDPRGALIGIDLALPLAPSREALAAFHEAHRARFHERDHVTIGYALAHPRTVVLEQGRGIKLSGGAHDPPLDGTLANLRDLLVDPTYGLVEEVTLSQPFEDHDAHWRRLIAAIPPSCRRVVIIATGLSVAAGHELVERLPPHVRELAIRRVHGGMARAVDIAPLLDDRFDTVELIDLDVTYALRDTLANTKRLRLRVRYLDGTFSSRIDIGDTALVRSDPTRATAISIVPWTLIQLQRRHGPISIRAQLGRAVPEGFDASPSFHRIAPNGHELLRHPSGAWTLRGHEHAVYEVDGEPLARDQIVRLDHGSRIRYGSDREPWVFLAHGANVEAHSLWG
jgi:hypothetical protein